MSYSELMELPIPLFWELSKNIERIRAEEDLRLMNAVGSLFGEDGKEYVDMLRDSIGRVAEGQDEDAPKLDKAGFGSLKARLGVSNVK